MLRQTFANGDLKVMGEIGAQYHGLDPSDEWFEPYLALAEEFDIPVGIHTGLAPPGTPYGCCPDFSVSLGNPLRLEPMLKRHPKLRVWMAHAGWPYLEETKAILYMYPQVHSDLSVINWIIPRQEFHDYLQALVTAGLGDRLHARDRGRGQRRVPDPGAEAGDLPRQRGAVPAVGGRRGPLPRRTAALTCTWVRDGARKEQRGHDGELDPDPFHGGPGGPCRGTAGAMESVAKNSASVRVMRRSRLQAW